MLSALWGLRACVRVRERLCFACCQKGKELEANSFHKGRRMQNYEGDRKEGLDRAPLLGVVQHTHRNRHYYIIINACVCVWMHACFGCWCWGIRFSDLLLLQKLIQHACSNQEECVALAVFNVGKRSWGCTLPLMISLGLFGNTRALLNGDHESPARRPAPPHFCFCCGKLGPMLCIHAWRCSPSAAWGLESSSHMCVRGRNHFEKATAEKWTAYKFNGRIIVSTSAWEDSFAANSKMHQLSTWRGLSEN
jgi:hypothetical protein